MVLIRSKRNQKQQEPIIKTLLLRALQKEGGVEVEEEERVAMSLSLLRQ